MPGDTSNSKAPLSDTVYFSPNLQYKKLATQLTIVWSMVEEIRIYYTPRFTAFRFCLDPHKSAIRKYT